MRRKGVTGWLIWGGLGILLFMVAHGLVSLQMRQSAVQGPPRRTTYSAERGGYKALYLWLRAMGVPAERWERDLRELTPEVTVTLMVEPEIHPGKAEWEALKGWIRGGGSLVLVVEPFSSTLDAFDLEPAAGGEGDGPQATIAQPGPYTRGVRTVQAKVRRGLTSKRPDAIIHVRGPEGSGLLTVLQEGKGRVIVLADPELFSNTGLKKDGHARLALNLLLNHLGKGRLAVDEYHHGYGRVSSVLEHLGRSRLAAPLLQGLILVFILWATKWRRFGPPRPLVEEERRSSMEYVRAMGGLLMRANAREFALESMIRWVEEEARRLLVGTDRSLQAAIKGARGRLGGYPLSDRQLVTTVRELYRALDGARRRAPGM